MSTTREVVSCRSLLDHLRSAAPFAQGLLLTTLPRGGLQVAQPLNVSEAVLRAYNEGLHAEDHLSWKAILSGEPVSHTQGKPVHGYENYVRLVSGPLGAEHVLALPLSGPVLDGYPGAVHLFRTSEQGPFSSEEVASLVRAVNIFEIDLSQARGSKRSGSDRSAAVKRPSISFIVLDGKNNPVLATDSWKDLDDGLRGQILEQSKKAAALTGENSRLDRLNLPDSHGDRWVFNRVVYKKYPAIGEGQIAFFCLQPECGDWGLVKPADLQADPELSRLIPAVKFMSAEYSRGPTLLEISQQVKLSPFHFHRRFTELLGMTPKQYMLACQIHQAKTDLLSGQKELATIAKECGFAHQSHFTSRFKQATGLTPTRWRRMALRRGHATSETEG